MSCRPLLTEFGACNSKIIRRYLEKVYKLTSLSSFNQFRKSLTTLLPRVLSFARTALFASDERSGGDFDDV